MVTSNDLAFSYFFGGESEQFSFIRIPKVFFAEERFEKLSYGAKILYGLLLERMGLSRKNKWIDEKNRVYIIYTIESIRESFHVSNSTACKLMKELEDFGLIEKKRRPNVAAMIYVKNFILEEVEEDNAQSCTQEESQEISGNLKNGIPEVQKMEFQKVEFQKSQEISGSLKNGIPENGFPEFQKIEFRNSKK